MNFVVQEFAEKKNFHKKEVRFLYKITNKDRTVEKVLEDDWVNTIGTKPNGQEKIKIANWSFSKLH